ncbi:putative FAD-binding component for oxidoreductase [Burkholderia cenocepacia]|uniref:FAD-dependent oxidoreductase n=1 Tax=Burkholderia cenocepacia TaxID=95486 RepID=UPI0008469E0D|nr:FAD-dependent oxidoreductase [Burkholderia cenocepacia]CAB5106336.1 putative FAD-binding component for oxidoreductase [Burkholderia cenocepacia]CAB5106966.1 putative FAD-binding component for oxidoreductase [Burkholderia cenocepacia]CAB5107154.1 putative FAD-binding component for oxidoreductase [Burkholderia cenocepacia]CAB5111377.1 putative FAD-binding component for oxidoreductase [Burkholderia cenocepacia]CAB5112908.1 putative FAD-binding component for oxidoreductase [Burkholderia cenocep
MSFDYSLTHPLNLRDVHRWDADHDVVIVGFGAAGACAAIEAASAGADTLIVERASSYGGTSALSGGEIYLGGSGGTPAQRQAGFTDDTEDLYRYLMLAGGRDADDAKVRLYANESLAHHDWLVAQGVTYKNTFIAERIVEPETDDCLIWSGSEEAWPFSEAAKPCPRGHTPQWPGWGGGQLLMRVLAERVAALGVATRYDTRAVALIVDDGGAVRGVVLRAYGDTVFVRARRAVILCAGGFAMNRDMVRRHAPQFLRSDEPIGSPGDDGSGILLGQSAGGAAIHMDEGFVSLPFYAPEALIKGIFVNARGQRFVNEDGYHGRTGHHAFHQADDRIYLLVDHATYQEPPAIARIGIAAAGETWEEVERDLRMPAGTLTATVDVYNRHAADGVDPLFHKAKQWLQPLIEPPFVALDCRIDYAFYPHFTLGGLDTLPTGQVLDATRTPVPGLYAAGRTTCGLPRWGAGYSSGLSLADATFFGRQAGRHAALAVRDAVGSAA